MPDAPRLLLPPGADLRARAGELVRQGWTPHEGFGLPSEPWWLGPARLVAVGSVSSQQAAEAALECVVRGVGLVVDLDPAAPWAVTFRGDVQRAVHAQPGDEPAEPPPGMPLSQEQRELLELVAAGHSLAQAARLRFLSLRTANRRVTEARELLGVATNREAVVAYVRLRDGA